MNVTNMGHIGRNHADDTKIHITCTGLDGVGLGESGGVLVNLHVM